MPTEPDPSVEALPVDPDVTSDDLPVRRRHPRLRDLVRDRADVVAAIAVGGALGSLGRWAVAELVPHDAGSFAWSTFTVNVTGALLLGLLMAFMVDVLAGTRYVRPLLGVGVLGGWTTFSTYMLDTRAMLADGRVPAALLLYLGGTLVVGLVCVWLGLAGGRGAIAVLGRAHRRRHGRELSGDRPEGRG
jgi:CrcB protein